jgi:4-diphosphocytidyl-2-C-methyl-D-erythritol kinase
MIWPGGYVSGRDWQRHRQGGGPRDQARGQNGRYDHHVVTPLTSASPAVTVRVPAKVNLQLAVGPVRPDGYHGVVTVYQAISLFDEVTVRAAEQNKIVVSGEDASLVPTGATNLASKAVTALARAIGRRGRGRNAVHIEIRKRIPMAAGLAGGSADAAAALVACNELWRAGLSQKELCEVGAGLGSDVPFALIGGTAVGRGRGEQLTAALAAGTYHWALAFATGGLSTPEVYATCDRLRAARADGGHGGQAWEPELSGPLMTALRSGDPAAVGPQLLNDLQAAAITLRPELRRTLTAGRENGALGAIVSGSGPTCAFLAPDASHAKDLAVSLTSAGVCRGVAVARGPVPGAAIVPAGDPA